jgi:hypothetical protein
MARARVGKSFACTRSQPAATAENASAADLALTIGSRFAPR